MENYKNVPQYLYGLSPSQMDMFMTEDNPVRRKADQIRFRFYGSNFVQLSIIDLLGFHPDSYIISNLCLFVDWIHISSCLFEDHVGVLEVFFSIRSHLCFQANMYLICCSWWPANRLWWPVNLLIGVFNTICPSFGVYLSENPLRDKTVHIRQT